MQIYQMKKLLKDYAKIIAGISLSLVLVGCTTTKTVYKDSLCERDRRIFISKKDVLTGQTARQILQNNDEYSIRCSLTATAVVVAKEAVDKLSK